MNRPGSHWLQGGPLWEPFALSGIHLGVSLSFEIFREPGSHGRRWVRANDPDGRCVHSEFFDWNVWEGHCSGMLLRQDFAQRAARKYEADAAAAIESAGEAGFLNRVRAALLLANGGGRPVYPLPHLHDPQAVAVRGALEEIDARIAKAQLSMRGAANLASAEVADSQRAQSDVPVVDLHEDMWAEIMRAASESAWMPAEYMANDWVADVCKFLREGPGAFLDADGHDAAAPAERQGPAREGGEAGRPR